MKLNIKFYSIHVILQFFKYSYISSSSRRSKLLVFYLVALCLANTIKRALRVSHTYQMHKMQPQQAAQAATLWMQDS